MLYRFTKSPTSTKAGIVTVPDLCIFFVFEKSLNYKLRKDR